MVSSPIRLVDATHAYSIYDTEIERNAPGPGAIDLLGLKKAIGSRLTALAPPNTSLLRRPTNRVAMSTQKKSLAGWAPL